MKALEALRRAKQLRASLAAMESADVNSYVCAYLGADVSNFIFQHHCMRLLLPGVGMTHAHQLRAPLSRIGL
jgi:hypothetical protein